MNEPTSNPTARIQQFLAVRPDYNPAASTFNADQQPRPRLGLLCYGGQVLFLALPGDGDELGILPTRLVGDPYTDRIHVIRGIDFWVGDRSLRNYPPNAFADILLNDLLDDILTGDFAAAADDRAFARRLRATGVPRVSGPCLILGRDESTDTSTGLPETFLDWLRRKAAQAGDGPPTR